MLAALEEIRVPATAEPPAKGDQGFDFVLNVGDHSLAVQVKTAITAGDADAILKARPRRDRLVVADRIAEQAKAAFRNAGLNFFDRRGELRLVAPPIIIDTRVSAPTKAPDNSDALSSQVSKETAIACLLTPDHPHGVREVAAFIERAPSAVSYAMARLRDGGLLTSMGEPTNPDLFQELASRWHRQPIALAGTPSPDRQAESARLGLGFGDADTTMGWALTDTLAAAAWGMPIVARGDTPPDFYVPNSMVLRRAVEVLGRASDMTRRACTVAIAPVRLVCLRRRHLDGQPWPVANHIVVALDIAADKARGSEALDQWRPEGIVRAW